MESELLRYISHLQKAKTQSSSQRSLDDEEQPLNVLVNTHCIHFIPGINLGKKKINIIIK